MAVNNLFSGNPVTAFFTRGVTTEPARVEMKKGIYAMSYTPAAATVSANLWDTNTTYTYNNGYAIVVVRYDLTWLFYSTIANTQVLLNRIEGNYIDAPTLELEVISTTSTYTGTGVAHKLLLFGGGTAGSPAPGASSTTPPATPLPQSRTTGFGGPGGAGGRGYVAQNVALPGSPFPVVIGAGGPAPGGGGGNTTFGPWSTAPTQPGSFAGGAGGAGAVTSGGNTTAGGGGTGVEPFVSPISVTPYMPAPLYPFSGGGGGPTTNEVGRGGGLGSGGGGGGSGYFGVTAGGGGGGGGVVGSPGGTAPGIGPGGAAGDGRVYIVRI